MHPRNLQLLRVHDACRGLTDDEFNQIVKSAEVVHAREGEQIHRANEAAQTLTLVLSGRLKISLPSQDGNDQIIRILSPGDQLGALSLLSGDPIPLDVIVDEDATLFKLPGPDAIQLMEQFPVFKRNLSRSLTTRLRQEVVENRSGGRSKVTCWLSADQETQGVIAEIVARLDEIGERVGVISDSKDNNYPPSVSTQTIGNLAAKPLNEQQLREFTAQWPSVDRLLIVVNQLNSLSELTELLRYVDEIYCLATTGNYQSVVDEYRKLTEQTPSLKKKSYFVWQLVDDEQVAPWVPNLLEIVQRDFKVRAFFQAEAGIERAGIERMIHHLRGVQIGIALSGGAARGMSHLGVLKVFDEAGIVIDRLAGTSAGVLTGVLYCGGYSPDWGIEHFTRDLQPGSIYKTLPKGSDWYVLHQYRTRSWDEMLRRYLHDWRLEQLPIPAQTLTTDLVSATQVVRETGDAVDSILESINLPVLSAPLCKDGMTLVDGGVLNNLPADVLVRKNCSFVIGVDVTSSIEKEFAGNYPETPTEQMKIPGAVATLIRCMNVQAHNLSAIGAASADLVINPDVSGFDSADFTKTPELAEIGQRATDELIAEIRTMLKRIDGNLF